MRSSCRRRSSAKAGRSPRRATSTSSTSGRVVLEGGIGGGVVETAPSPWGGGEGSPERRSDGKGATAVVAPSGDGGHRSGGVAGTGGGTSISTPAPGCRSVPPQTTRAGSWPRGGGDLPGARRHRRGAGHPLRSPPPARRRRHAPTLLPRQGLTTTDPPYGAGSWPGPGAGAAVAGGASTTRAGVASRAGPDRSPGKSPAPTVTSAASASARPALNGIGM